MTEIVKILEKNGFSIDKDEYGYNLQRYTPEGEDWQLHFNNLADILDYAENYSPDEDFEMWVDAKKGGFAGVPEYGRLWKDQLWKQKLLKKIKKQIERPATKAELIKYIKEAKK